MASRKAVPEGTKRILFLKSRNRCAFPGCNTPLVELPIGNSPHKIIGEICHIHSVKEDGPRGKIGLTSDEYNTYDNLIMLCPNHHTIVDGQDEAYPAESLRGWKETHELKSYQVSAEDLGAPPEVFYHRYFPTALVDQTIEEEVGLLRRSRFLVEFDGAGRAIALARRLLNDDLFGGTTSTRASALAWCARILAGQEKLDEAEKYRDRVCEMGGDTRIVDAFICSQRESKCAALSILANDETPNALSTRLMITRHHDGPQEAVTWLTDANLGITDLDPDGKLAFLMYTLELGQWETALESAKSLNDSDLEEAPVLQHMVALAYLLDTVHRDYRNVVLRQIPFNAKTIPLNSSLAAIESRRKARAYFTKAAKALRQLDCRQTAAELDGYALWIELQDPEHSERAEQRLEGRFGELEFPLHLVSLGLQYGVPIDPAKVEYEIERQATPHGEITLDGALARLAIARLTTDPEESAEYITKHYNSLSTHLDSRMIRSYQIEMFAVAGLVVKANEHLELLLEDELSVAEESRLRIAIAESNGEDTREDRKALYRQTGLLPDLEAIVKEMGTRKDWEGLCEHAEILFGETHFVQDAELLATGLNSAKRFDRVVELLGANKVIIEQSEMLRMFYCWALYFEGDLLSARSELAKLSPDLKNMSFRELHASIGISLGDWDSLSVYIAEEYQAKEDRNSRDLINAAQLALCVDSPYAKQLALAAAAKDNADASVLASVYFLASKAGWENDPQFVRCLHRAVELSGDDGPIMNFSLRDLLDMKPEWDRQESSARDSLNRGQAPMFFAAQLLNRTLVSLMLFPALANSSERDLRRKVGIPAFSGQRRSRPLETNSTVGLDYTTLLTLNFLGILDKVIDAFDTVYVPHSALTWLFEERQNASFHQRSRIKDASHLLHLLGSGSLKKLTSNAIANIELSEYVGQDLATFIAEAENTKNGDAQRLVVRPFPVYEAVSLGTNEADLTSHYSVLVSCQAIVEKLSHMAEILDSVEENALAYLRLHEKPWPNQPEIADDAILYLDDLTIYYLLHTGILDILCKQDFTLFVSSGLVSELNALIAYESMSDMAIEAIENIRATIRQGIECGKVKVGKWRSIGSSDEQYLDYHQIAGLFAIAEDCDAIVADDRFFNQTGQNEHRGGQTSPFTTLDLLDTLVSASQISADSRFEFRTKLRRAGYFFVPVDEYELAFHLKAAEIKNGEVIETAHLRAIRESILYVRMTDWLQLPNEALWLDSVFEVLVDVLRSLWTESDDFPKAQACSNWILDQVDVRGWAHCLSPESRNEIIESGQARIVVELITTLPAHVPPNVRKAYRDWAEDFVLTPIKELEPDLYNLIVNLERRHISEHVDTYMKKRGEDAE